ncbi:MAG: adenylate/guanylate cyclase domain-containing protein [Actinomycetota bacterium]
MTELPSGTVTFLFTDIEGSTRLLQSLGDDFGRLSDDHCKVLRKVFESREGHVVSTEGDSFFVAFKSAPSALNAAAEATRALAAHPWPQGAQVKVRMGLHTGEGTFGGDNYVGLDVHRGARIANAGHGGQILISATTRSLIEAHLTDELKLQDLGEHRLKDLEFPERLYQLSIQGLQSEFPMLRSLNARPNNLPPQLTSFIGRTDQIQALKKLMRSTRLLTLSGPGGTGKTRLSIQAAAELLGDFSDGVFFVALAPITDPGLFQSTIAQTLGLQESRGRPIADALDEFLVDKQMLLVLDNFEQILDAAPEISHILTAAPGIKIMVSSRAVLHVSGEQEYPVPPLELPDYKSLPSLEALTQFEAVALFIQRGTAVKLGFEVTNENAPAVAEICARLDGLPLAIELAAARLRVLTPQAILDRLQNRLSLLTGGGSDLPARQQTLRNAISWSFDLLAPAEQCLFKRLAVFTGGWTFEDCEAICNPNQELGVDTIDGLSSLVDKSLVRQHQDRHGDSRFLMLETIREYGLEMLGAGNEEDALIKRRHAEAFMSLAQQAGSKLLGPDQDQWLNRLEDEHDNIRSALMWAIQTDNARTGLETAFAVWRFWHLRGQLREGRQWFTDLLALPTAGIRDAARSKGLNGLGSLAYWQSDFEATAECYAEALSINREIVDEAGIAESLYNLAFLAAVGREYEKSKAFYEECQALNRKLGNDSAAAYARFGLSMVAWLEDDYEAGKKIANESLSAFTALDDKFGIANSNGILARIAIDEKDWAGALKTYAKSLDDFAEIGDMSGVSAGLDDIAAAAAGLGLPELSVRLGGASEAIKQKIGGRAPDSLTKFVDPREAARKTLTEAEVDQAWTRGQAMSADDAMVEARELIRSHLHSSG